MVNMIQGLIATRLPLHGNVALHDNGAGEKDRPEDSFWIATHCLQKAQVVFLPPSRLFEINMVNMIQGLIATRLPLHGKMGSAMLLAMIMELERRTDQRTAFG
jgi:hypothetical protein